MIAEVGRVVKVYGGNSLHDKNKIFSNGCMMLILEVSKQNGASWVRCRHNDLNEKTVTEYWFLEEQLRSIE